MRTYAILLLVLPVSAMLTACGGGSTSSPYDGTWQAVYPSAGITSTFTETKVVECNTPPATLIMDKAAGTTIQSSTCVTTIIDPAIQPVLDATGAVITPGTPEVRTTYAPQQIDYYIGVVIKPQATGSGNFDVLNAIVNGVSFSGECISTAACSAVSPDGNTLSLTR